MNTYKPDIKIYYGNIANENRLIPAPDISIAVNYKYSNDTIIGYTYNITLTGVATALDLRELAYGDEITDSNTYNLGAVSDHIYKLRQILSQNGNILRIVKGSDDSDILKARGGILRSFSVEPSPNNWIHYANYTAVIEFQTVDFMSSQDSCGTPFLDPTTYSAGKPGIVDIAQFKLKSFEDSWSLTFDETEAYNRIKNNELGNNINIDNSSFNIQYKISAVGQHHYVYESDDSTPKLLPAWEQAKNFVQYRLYNQVSSLINKSLKNSYASGCSSSDFQADINDASNSSEDGLYKGLGDDKYTIYNEEITCETSESDGSFSATYSAIVKRKSSTTWNNDDTRHSITKSIKTVNSGSKIKSILLEGTIEGLIEGGLIRSGVPLTLPSSGSLFIYSDGSSNKYDKAKTLWDLIETRKSTGPSGKRDIDIRLKNLLGITWDQLNISPSNTDLVSEGPHPSSFNLTHDYNKGTINYSIEYSNNTVCGRRYREFSVQISNPTDVYASFNRPNSGTGPLIQKLDTKTAKKVTVTIQGVDLSNSGKPDIVNFSSVFNCDMENLPVGIPSIGTSILTGRQLTKNLSEGSFTLSLTYICDTQGCNI